MSNLLDFNHEKKPWKQPTFFSGYNQHFYPTVAWKIPAKKCWFSPLIFSKLKSNGLDVSNLAKVKAQKLQPISNPELFVNMGYIGYSFLMKTFGEKLVVKQDWRVGQIS